MSAILIGEGRIFWKPGVGVHFLEVQRAEVVFIDGEFRWFFKEFLVNPSVVDDVLHKPLVDQLVHIHRPLSYGETFILVPWLMIGGTDNVDRYEIGKCSVYLDLVSQAYLKNR